MPRKTTAAPNGIAAASLSFNEAAARCRGKRKHRSAGAGGLRGASMRPRPDAAENPGVGKPEL